MKKTLFIFVKTPAIGKVKTRLAQSIGNELALEFYQRSVGAIKSVIRDLQAMRPELKIIWAVAEEENLNHPLWNDFQTQSQGIGNLGDRLNHIYQSTNGVRIFIGADSPHISAMKWNALIQDINVEEHFYLAKTEDGGFYFFAGSNPISLAQWNSVPWSTDKTSSVFQEILEKMSVVHHLSPDYDIDEFPDLKKLIRHDRSDMNEEQLELMDWCESLFSK